ncbi:YggS family pyridoxal phosphate-dependent enzyme [Bartonella sp. HY329]|uniref:YggS family pyridoxal phosphate-dependent enzyme n=1 Tax=unclassified Bartonella TaxID=2645622 RepID=UPI0021C9B68E|nr:MULTISPECIES: YggS family pyridoxal phosphate-dependent enzyme [unclassified Bartonella]UXM95896.1 YggS family pyridoxal phosphate-dependent enzyme [Bartonella sp. HY329]UXN10221.1 YggS family pyridoxal phosphate-dependent enzyme [Bartonella sp. HY328]
MVDLDEDKKRFGNDPKNLFADNLKVVHKRIAIAAAATGRQASDIRLLVVTKTVPAHILRFVHDLGIDNFGENKIQEAKEKSEILADLNIRWSMIGHLQSNKVKYLVRFASEFQALDSLTLAEELNRRLDNLGRDLDVFVQVNTSGEESKYGLHPDDLLPFLESLKKYPRLKPKGLMTLAILSDDPVLIRPCFKLLKQLRDTARNKYPEIEKLSMGMSGDFEMAIEEGADVVRVGQAIFGPRPTKDSDYWPALFH